MMPEGWRRATFRETERWLESGNPRTGPYRLLAGVGLIVPDEDPPPAPLPTVAYQIGEWFGLALILMFCCGLPAVLLLLWFTR